MKKGANTLGPSPSWMIAATQIQGKHVEFP